MLESILEGRLQMKKVVDKILEIWGSDSIPTPEFLVFLILEQIEELDRDNYSYETLRKEIPDIISISIQYLKHMGLDPEKEILTRLETRHRGNKKSIVQKYVKKWLNRLNELEAERKDPILDEKPSIGDY